MSSTPHALPEGYELKSDRRVYRIVKVLGNGGFGITYLASSAIQVENVSITANFALKELFLSDSCERDVITMSVHYSNPTREKVENSRKDFLAEARRLHKVGIEHPNIVKVNEVFEANNTAYYVMEYLDGESLRDYVRRSGPLGEEEMLSLMKPVIGAVGYLHRNRMTHLDIKPDNIMLVRNQSGATRPVLIDFGLSKHYDDDGHPTSTLNALGVSNGYAPIEQYAGITSFTPQADVYALGATMLFCLTGNDPKKATELRPGDVEKQLDAIPVTATLRESISKAMAPFDRPQSVDALIGSQPEPATKNNEPKTSSASKNATVAIAPKQSGTPRKDNTEARQQKKTTGHKPAAATKALDTDSSTYRQSGRRSRLPLVAGGIIAAALIIGAVILFVSSGNSSDDNLTETSASPAQTVGANNVIYDDADNEKVISVERDGKDGIIDLDGNIIIPCEYEFAGLDGEGRIAVKKNGKAGYADMNGNIVIPLIYRTTLYFSGGLAMVTSDDGKYAAIDKTGKIVIPFEERDIILQKDVPLAVCMTGSGNGKRYGLIDKTGKTVVPYIYDDMGYFISGVIRVRKNGKYGVLDLNGKTVIEPRYDMVSINNDMINVSLGKKSGVLDASGKTILPMEYDDVRLLGGNMIAVKQDGRYSCVDRNGNLLIPADMNYDYYDTVKEGLLKVKKDGQWAFVDTTGQMVIPFMSYGDANFGFRDGRAQFKQNGLYGYIDKTGKPAIPARYSGADEFRNGVAKVSLTDAAGATKTGLIDTDGNVVVPIIYDKINNYYKGAAQVTLGNETFFINCRGERVDF